MYRKLVPGNEFGNIYFFITGGMYIAGKCILFGGFAKWNADVYHTKDIQKTIQLEQNSQLWDIRRSDGYVCTSVSNVAECNTVSGK